MAERISRCRICGNENLVQILDLGDQAMTGTFPKSRGEDVGHGPLQLVKCLGDEVSACGLVQLAHNFAPDDLYGANYGYRSGLNASMVRHLKAKVERIRAMAPLRDGDFVIDIGSNDATTLAAYPEGHYDLLGVDPTGAKFREYYPPHIDLITEFFTLANVEARVGPRRARVITSIAMFYDLEAPLDFTREVVSLLADDGIWVLEQSYMPEMLATNGYDTICHEHLEYYGLGQIKWMTDRCDAKIVDVEFNDVNGGSFSVTVARASAPQPEAPMLAELLARERDLGLAGLEPYRRFACEAARHRDALLDFLAAARSEGKIICGLGASTKGNVLLQYCGLTVDDIAYIGEVNPDKFGTFTPGTLIPIVPEDEMLARDPDYLLVLPWHFRKFFEDNPKFAGRSLLFPLPQLEVVRSEIVGR